MHEKLKKLRKLIISLNIFIIVIFITSCNKGDNKNSGNNSNLNDSSYTLIDGNEKNYSGLKRQLIEEQFYNIEKCNYQNGTLFISGWAFNPINKNKAKAIFVDIDDSIYNVINYQLDRQDVADYTKNQNSVFTGFDEKINYNPKKNGLKKIGILVLSDKEDILYEGTNSFELPISYINSVQSDFSKLPIQNISDQFYNIEKCEYKNGNLYISGWAFNPISKNKANTIIITIDNKYYTINNFPINRPDVAEYGKNNNIRLSGFEENIKYNPENSGVKKIGILVLSEKADVLYEGTNEIEITIK